jgi:ABC-type branched-subunit amino acid transport system substrate-binding protein
MLCILKANEPSSAFDFAFYVNLNTVSAFALACCSGNTTAADSIATAATIPTISKVEFFICLFKYLLVYVL